MQARLTAVLRGRDECAIEVHRGEQVEFERTRPLLVPKNGNPLIPCWLDYDAKLTLSSVIFPSATLKSCFMSSGSGRPVRSKFPSILTVTIVRPRLSSTFTPPTRPCTSSMSSPAHLFIPPPPRLS